jgi:hypothetical protein
MSAARSSSPHHGGQPMTLAEQVANSKRTLKNAIYDAAILMREQELREFMNEAAISAYRALSS